MKKFKLFLLTGLLVLLVSACVEIGVEEAISVSLDWQPEMAYVTDANIDIKDYTLEVEFTEDRIETISYGDDRVTISGNGIAYVAGDPYLVLDEVGPKTVNFSFSDLSVTATYYVADAIVDLGSPGPNRIQKAIDAAAAGDTIFVYPGTYVGNLVILKDDLSLIGPNYGISAGANPGTRRSEAIIDANGAANGVFLQDYSGGNYRPASDHANNFTIDGFTVTNWMERGVGQRNSSNSHYIYNNIVVGPQSSTAVRSGIAVSGGSGSEIIGNRLYVPEFGQDGWSTGAIALWGSDNALVEDNWITGTAEYGVVLMGFYPSIDASWDDATFNTISGNLIQNNGYAGVVYYGNANDNDIVENTINGVYSSAPIGSEYSDGYSQERNDEIDNIFE